MRYFLAARMAVDVGKTCLNKLCVYRRVALRRMSKQAPRSP